MTKFEAIELLISGSKYELIVHELQFNKVDGRIEKSIRCFIYTDGIQKSDITIVGNNFVTLKEMLANKIIFEGIENVK